MPYISGFLPLTWAGRVTSQACLDLFQALQIFHSIFIKKPSYGAMLKLCIWYWSFLCSTCCSEHSFSHSSLEKMWWKTVLYWEVLHSNTASISWFKEECSHIFRMKYIKVMEEMWTSMSDFINLWFLLHLQILSAQKSTTTLVEVHLCSFKQLSPIESQMLSRTSPESLRLLSLPFVF